MTPILPNLRYERKFIANRLPLAELLAIVRRHPSGFRETFPPRIVNNIYLDSPGRQDYQDHIHGAANRIKTRVRWYGRPTTSIDRPALELKLKRGLVSGKQTHLLKPLSLGGAPLHPALKSNFAESGLHDSMLALLLSREPAVFNRYHRHYFLSRDRRFRLTVDSELEFAGAVPGCGAPNVRISRCPSLILELKFASEHAEHAPPVTNALPFRVARCSKYVLGVQLGATP